VGVRDDHGRSRGHSTGAAGLLQLTSLEARPFSCPCKASSGARSSSGRESLPNAALHRYNSLYDAAIKNPIHQEHDGVTEAVMRVAPKEGPHPTGDDNSRQAEYAGPNPRSGVHAGRARDHCECDGPRNRKQQCPKRNFHADPFVRVFGACHLQKCPIRPKDHGSH
jgi:hypothetical protein